MPGQQAYFRVVLSPPGSVVTQLCARMVQSALYTVAHLILICHYPHITDGEVKAHSSEVVEPRIEPKQPSFKFHALTIMPSCLSWSQAAHSNGAAPKAMLCPRHHIPSSPPDKAISLPANSNYEGYYRAGCWHKELKLREKSYGPQQHSVLPAFL